MKRSIVITDLTRFKPGNPKVCTAGVDPETGECIRPIPYLTFDKCRELGVLPGGILTGDFNPVPDRRAPHTEDCHWQELSFEGPCSGREFRNILEGSCFPSIEAGFEVSLPVGERVISGGHAGQRSIITVKVRPDELQIVEDRYKAGGIKLHFKDSAGCRHAYFPITDLGFYDYARRMQDSRALPGLNHEIARQEEVFLRIGLSRRYTNSKGKDGYWLQANGIYTFPTALRYIRSYGPNGAGTR
jgi:hypothetical protein